MFIFISHSLLYSFSEININYLATVHKTQHHHSYTPYYCDPPCLFAKTWTHYSYQAVSTFLSHSEITRISKKHNIHICIADCHHIYDIVTNMNDVYRHHRHYDTVCMHDMSYPLNWLTLHVEESKCMFHTTSFMLPKILIINDKIPGMAEHSFNFMVVNVTSFPWMKADKCISSAINVV
jgi:hypothetical protein